MMSLVRDCVNPLRASAVDGELRSHGTYEEHKAHLRGLEVPEGGLCAHCSSEFIRRISE